MRYVGNQWYQVNGELVYRSDLLMETSRHYQHRNADKGMIIGLIAKLCSL